MSETENETTEPTAEAYPPPPAAAAPAPPGAAGVGAP